MSASPLVRLFVTSRRREELIDVTGLLHEAVSTAGVREGILVAGTAHTTAGLTVNENADPDVTTDLLAQLAVLARPERPFRHGEGNSDAHVKATLVGASVTLPVTEGRLVLGTWQGVYFCEFDGPRRRTVHARVLG